MMLLFFFSFLSHVAH